MAAKYVALSAGRIVVIESVRCPSAFPIQSAIFPFRGFLSGKRNRVTRLAATTITVSSFAEQDQDDARSNDREGDRKGGNQGEESDGKPSIEPSRESGPALGRRIHHIHGPVTGKALNSRQAKSQRTYVGSPSRLTTWSG